MNEFITQKVSERLEYLCRKIPPLLKAIPEQEFSNKPGPEKWSKKQIIGHLIDSATNNHHRFIRARIEDAPNIFYNQDEWIRLSNYNKMNSDDLILLWTLYNKFLSRLVKNMTPGDLDRKCFTGKSDPYTLAFIVEDYVVHLEHHLHQVVDY